MHALNHSVNTYWAKDLAKTKVSVKGWEEIGMAGGTVQKGHEEVNYIAPTMSFTEVAFIWLEAINSLN